MRKQDSISQSLPGKKMVRGYEMRRAPLGAFLQAMKQLQDFPAMLMESVFQGQSVDEILLSLKTADSKLLITIFTRALAVAPEQLLTLIADLSGISQSELKDDPNIGLDGLVEIIAAWMEVNDIENFTRTASGLWAKAKALAGTKAGSNV